MARSRTGQRWFGTTKKSEQSQRDGGDRISRPARFDRSGTSPHTIRKGGEAADHAPRHRRPGRPHRTSATRAEGHGLGHGGVGDRPPGEQGAVQAGALVEAPFLGGTHGLVCECAFNLRHSPRQLHCMLPGTDRRCDRGVNGRDLSPLKRRCRGTISNAQHVRRRS